MTKEKESDSSPIAFEAALEQLQEAVKKIESGELTLEESLKNFEEGVRLARLCQQQLTAAEQKVEVLTRVNADGQIQTEQFKTDK